MRVCGSLCCFCALFTSRTNDLRDVVYDNFTHTHSDTNAYLYTCWHIENKKKKETHTTITTCRQRKTIVEMNISHCAYVAVCLQNRNRKVSESETRDWVEQSPSVLRTKENLPKKLFMGLHRIFSEKCRNMYVVFFFLVDPLYCYCCCRRQNDLLCLLLFTLQECSNQHILWESDFLLGFFLPLPFHVCSVRFTLAKSFVFS